MSLFVLWGTLFSVTYAQADAPKEQEMTEERKFTDNPTDLVREVYRKANDDFGSKVQNTDLDNVSSKYCSELYLRKNFTLARTLCNIKWHMWAYLQYITYFWIAAALIFIIRNWFKIVTSSDREKQMWTFKKNLLYVTIWIVLLIAFNYIIDIFVSVVTLVLE